MQSDTFADQSQISYKDSSNKNQIEKKLKQSLQAAKKRKNLIILAVSVLSLLAFLLIVVGFYRLSINKTPRRAKGIKRLTTKPTKTTVRKTNRKVVVKSEEENDDNLENDEEIGQVSLSNAQEAHKTFLELNVDENLAAEIIRVIQDLRLPKPYYATVSWIKSGLPMPPTQMPFTSSPGHAFRQIQQLMPNCENSQLTITYLPPDQLTSLHESNAMQRASLSFSSYNERKTEAKRLLAVGINTFENGEISIKLKVLLEWLATEVKQNEFVTKSLNIHQGRGSDAGGLTREFLTSNWNTLAKCDLKMLLRPDPNNDSLVSINPMLSQDWLKVVLRMWYKHKHVRHGALYPLPMIASQTLVWFLDKSDNHYNNWKNNSLSKKRILGYLKWADPQFKELLLDFDYISRPLLYEDGFDEEEAKATFKRIGEANSNQSYKEFSAKQDEMQDLLSNQIMFKLLNLHLRSGDAAFQQILDAFSVPSPFYRVVMDSKGKERDLVPVPFNDMQEMKYAEFIKNKAWQPNDIYKFRTFVDTLSGASENSKYKIYGYDEERFKFGPFAARMFRSILMVARQKIIDGYIEIALQQRTAARTEFKDLIRTTSFETAANFAMFIISKPVTTKEIKAAINFERCGFNNSEPHFNSLPIGVRTVRVENRTDRKGRILPPSLETEYVFNHITGPDFVEKTLEIIQKIDDFFSPANRANNLDEKGQPITKFELKEPGIEMPYYRLKSGLTYKEAFVKFFSGAPTITEKGLNINCVDNTETGAPLAHTCFSSVDMPKYGVSPDSFIRSLQGEDSEIESLSFTNS